MPDLAGLGRTAEREFLEIVNFAAVIGNKLRVEILDGSYIAFWWSTQIPGRYAYHWERGHIDGTIYRHDNIPHLSWQGGVLSPSIFILETGKRLPKAIYPLFLRKDYFSFWSLPPGISDKPSVVARFAVFYFPALPPSPSPVYNSPRYAG